MKTCTRCKIQKEEEKFRVNKDSKDGLHCWCRECESELRRETIEQQRLQGARWRKAHADEVKIKNKIYREANKDKLNKQARIKYALDPERFNAYKRTWNERNPAKRQELDSRACETMSDSYIANMLVKYTQLKRNDIPQELIELKRLQLKITRELRNCK